MGSITMAKRTNVTDSTFIREAMAGHQTVEQLARELGLEVQSVKLRIKSYKKRFPNNFPAQWDKYIAPKPRGRKAVSVDEFAALVSDNS